MVPETDNPPICCIAAPPAAPALRSLPIEATSIPLLVRSITHELRQPLSLIVAYAELLATAPDEPARARLLDGVRQAAREIAGALTRLERGGACSLRTFGAEDEHQVLDLR